MHRSMVSTRDSMKGACVDKSCNTPPQPNIIKHYLGTYVKTIQLSSRKTHMRSSISFSTATPSKFFLKLSMYVQCSRSIFMKTPHGELSNWLSKLTMDTYAPPQDPHRPPALLAAWQRRHHKVLTIYWCSYYPSYETQQTLL